MKLQLRTGRCGFTLIEFIVIVGVLIVLALLLSPRSHGHKASASRINCVNNLKMAGLAFAQWSQDHGGDYPMQASPTNGGTRGFVEGGEVWPHFLVLSNELNSLKVLRCPTDKKRPAAPTFSKSFGNANVSYFVGVDADKSMPQMLLTGDRNLTSHPTNLTGFRPGLLTLTSNTSVAWTEDLHNKSGNVGLTDGSVQQFTRNRLMEALRSTGAATNRLAIP